LRVNILNEAAIAMQVHGALTSSLWSGSDINTRILSHLKKARELRVQSSPHGSRDGSLWHFSKVPLGGSLSPLGDSQYNPQGVEQHEHRTVPYSHWVQA